MSGGAAGPVAGPRAQCRVRGRGDRRGVASAYLSLIVLIPLAAVVGRSLDGGLGGFWDACPSPEAVRR